MKDSENNKLTWETLTMENIWKHTKHLICRNKKKYKRHNKHRDEMFLKDYVKTKRHDKEL